MSSKAITIYTPSGTEPHIAAQDDAFIYDSLLGGRSGILGDLTCTLTENGKARLSGGGVSNRGYILWVPTGENCDLAVSNGTQGFMRRDIVAAQFTKGNGISPDEHTFVILEGTPAAQPADPVLTTSQLLNPGDVSQLALFRIVLNDLDIVSVERIAPYAAAVPEAAVAQSCSGNAASADVAAACTGNAVSASTAARCTGNSATASALQTARKITLTGDASGNVNFNGSQNVSMSVSVRGAGGHAIYIQSSEPSSPAAGDIWLW